MKESVVSDFPFEEQQVGSNLFVRTFSPETDPFEFVWHRDREDRILCILEGGGWSFQFENQIPFLMENSDKIFIPTGEYHRVIPGNSYLEILIEKL